MRFTKLPKRWKMQIVILSSISVLFFISLITFNLFLNEYRSENEKQRTKLIKKGSELIGERIEISRDGKSSIKANLYIPDSIDNKQLPVVFNIHKGGFVGGGADVLDTQSNRIANEWNVVVVTINYTKADVKPIAYGCEDIKDMESAGLKPDVIELKNAVHSFIESNNPEGMIENSVDMFDVINSEQESLAREAEVAISKWIFTKSFASSQHP